MATTKIQKEMTGMAQNFIGLWNRYYTLYLENGVRQDITSEKENEFLKFQGTIAEQLVPVLELDDKSRFDIRDKVMSVLNEVVSLDLYTKLSEFQINRVKHQWQEAMEELEKLYRFCDTYDPKMDKVQKITEVKRKNPFWDPTSGSMRDILTRLIVVPVTFFQGLKAGVHAERIGSFIFFVFLIPILIILTIVFLISFDTVKIIGKNVVVEAGLLSSNETGFVPNIIIAAAVLAGLLIIAFTLTVILTVLHYVYTWFLHFGFRLTGARESYSETFKAVTYGAAPFLAVVTAPYSIILQIIGGSKVHKYPYILSTIGWIIGTILFLVLIFSSIGAAFYLGGVVPPIGEKYAFVKESQTDLYDDLERNEVSSVQRGIYLPLSDSKAEVETKTIGEKPNRRKAQVYKIKYNEKAHYVEKDNVEIIQFTWGRMPRFIIDKSLSTINGARSFLDGIIKKYSE